MKQIKRGSWFGVLAACLAAAWLGGCASNPPAPTESPITHFRWIDQGFGICASAQPVKPHEWLWLASQNAGQSGQGMGHVNHIIKLNDDARESDGMAVISYGFDLDFDPIGVMWEMNPLYHAELDQHIREVCHLIRPGTLVHCKLGKDRTGAVVLQYRLNCGWPVEAARLELETNGFNHALLGLDYFVKHARAELGVTNTPKAWKAVSSKHQ